MYFVQVGALVTATNWLEALLPSTDAEAGTAAPLTFPTKVVLEPEVVTSPLNSAEERAVPFDLKSPAEKLV